MYGRYLTILVLGIGSLAGICRASAEELTIKFSHFLGPKSFFQTDFVEPWARELEQSTNGRVKVEVFNSESPFGKVTEQASQVKAGTIDIALGLRGAEGDRFIRSSVVELPFATTDALSGSRALWNLYKDGTLADEYRDYKVLALFVHNPGLVHTMSKNVVKLEDFKSLRLRSPNRTVSTALEFLGATPVILQFNEVIDALKSNKIDGVVTNWGTAIPGATDYLKKHTDIRFYTSAFFVVMNKQRYDRLAPEIREAVDRISGETLVARFGPLWDQWDQPMLEASRAPGHEIVEPDPETVKAWREGLQPVTDNYLADLAKRGFPDARAAYEKVVSASGQAAR